MRRIMLAKSKRKLATEMWWLTSSSVCDCLFFNINDKYAINEGVFATKILNEPITNPVCSPLEIGNSDLA